MTVSYKSLGLVNTRDMFAKAIKGGYAIPAYNFNNMEQLQAIIQACVETESPLILQVSKGAREYANQTLLRYMAQGAVEYAKEINNGKSIPIVLHLDGLRVKIPYAEHKEYFDNLEVYGRKLPEIARISESKINDSSTIIRIKTRSEVEDEDRKKNAN